MISMAVPPHVSDHLVEEFDYYQDSQLKVDPVNRYNELGRRHPEGVFYSVCNGGFWVICGFDAYCEAAKNTAVFSSDTSGSLPLTNENLFVAPPISVDPPEHIKFRVPVNSYFSKPRVRNMENKISDLVEALVDEMLDKRAINFVTAFAEPLPITLFMEMMGLPISRLREFRDYATEYLGSPCEVRRADLQQKILGLMEEVVIERRTRPCNDIISGLNAITIDNRAITHEEILGYCFVFFLAGLDTVVNALNYAVLYLARNPAVMQEIKGNPLLVDAFVEESLRRFSFVNTMRSTTQDTEFFGVSMKAGEPVILSGSAANLDPKAFDHPLKFDLHRKRANHVAFSTGPHHCMGAPLARLEMQIAIRHLCARFKSMALSGSDAVEYSGGGAVAAISRLDLQLS
ncbi:MAG: cytochrome P450 [Pseudomonadales bacterium]|jgi:cytochrome P450|nr:cytochrome P450 [Pseudomonadales bacterium]